MHRGKGTSKPSRKPPTQRASTANQDPLLVTETEKLREICEQLGQEKSFAFDTEFIMEDRFKPEIGLIQLATDNVVALVDPYKVDDLSPIWTLIADPEIEVIVHAGSEDLNLAHAESGLLPQNVFDCQIACGMITTDFPLSLARITRNLLRVRLHKSQTLTDWRRRPLTPEQMRYAADDVIYLPAIRRAIQTRIEKLDRTDWMGDEMSRFSDPATYQRSDQAKAVRLKGAGSLDGLGLAIARELVGAREILANEYNRPVRTVVRDHLIVEIARHRWTKPSDIRKLRGMNLRNSALSQLGSAVERACALPEEDWPPVAPTNDETDQEAALAMLLGSVLRTHCEQQDVSHQLVASKADLREFTRTRVRSEPPTARLPLDGGWRQSFVGQLISDVLSGNVPVRVKDGIVTIGE
ncbi:MAG: ribonuclease D [Planctomycetes bacterium]|nr:ribonuclease D [Planctomycetota bacterium]